MIGKTKTHGNIFGNTHALKHFPANDILQGGCIVLLAEYKTSIYAVLVQVKKRPYLMSPVGYMERSDASLKDAAIREVLEEPGLKINPDE